jgi:hypothetical protein
MGTIFGLIGVLFLVSLIPAAWIAVRAFMRYRHPRAVRCPEGNCSAIVEVDRLHATRAAVTGESDLRVKFCSRWPEHAACGQECVSQIEATPA